MKSVDRDFDRNGIARHFWTLAYVIMVFGVLAVFARLWNEIHLHGLPFGTLIRIVGLPFIYVCPLILSLQSRRYVRSALKENLISERVANNYEFLLGLSLMIVYIAIMQFAFWD